MDKLYIILDKSKKLEAGQKEIQANLDRLEIDVLSLRMDNKSIHRKLDVIASAVIVVQEEITMLKAQ